MIEGAFSPKRHPVPRRSLDSKTERVPDEAQRRLHSGFRCLGGEGKDRTRVAELRSPRKAIHPNEACIEVHVIRARAPKDLAAFHFDFSVDEYREFSARKYSVIRGQMEDVMTGQHEIRPHQKCGSDPDPISPARDEDGARPLTFALQYGAWDFHPAAVGVDRFFIAWFLEESRFINGRGH